MINSKIKQAGFTLLETMVAFAILVIVLGVVFQIFSGGARAQRLASEYSEANIIARSILNKSKNHSIEDQGTINSKYSWKIDRHPFYPPELTSTEQTVSFVATKVIVHLTWTSAGRERQLQQSTVLLENPVE